MAALRNPGYYEQRYRETAALRAELAADLERILPGAEILAGVANWVLCLLARDGQDAALLCERSRSRGVFLRDSGATSAVLGRHALRVAVKDETANRRIVETLAWALGGAPPPTPYPQ